MQSEQSSLFLKINDFFPLFTNYNTLSKDEKLKTIKNLTNHLKISLIDIRTLYFTKKWSTLFTLIVNNSEPDHYPFIIQLCDTYYTNIPANHSDLRNLTSNQLNSNITSEKLEFIISILRILLYSQFQSISYFSFNGEKSSLKHITNGKNHLKWPFNQGFGFGIWLFPEESHNCSLFLIHCFEKGGGGLEFYQIGTKIYYRVLNINYEINANENEGVYLLNIDINKWNYIAFEYEKQHLFSTSSRSWLKIYKNNEPIRKVLVDLPRIEVTKTVKELHFCEGFKGKISSLFIFMPFIVEKCYDIYQLFPNGFQNGETLEDFRIFLGNLFDRLILLYSPLRVSEKICYDPINDYNSEFFGTSGPILKACISRPLFYWIEILPLFYYLRFCKENKTNLINQLIRILISSLNIRKNSDSEADFFKIMSVLCNEIEDNIIDIDTIELLAELRVVLQDKRLAEHFFIDFVWNLELVLKSNDSIIIQDYFKLIRIFYHEKPTFYIPLINLSEMIILALFKFDSQTQRCCSYHALILGTEDLDLENERKINPILNIVEIILFSNEILPNKKILEETILTLSSIIINKTSPCFSVQILNMIKNFICDPKKEDFLSILIDQKIVYKLLYVFTNTLCSDIKALSIKILNYLTNSNKKNYKYLSNHDLLTFLSFQIFSSPNKKTNQINLSKKITGSLRYIKNTANTIILKSYNEIESSEILYNSIMEWALNKIPGTLESSLLIDDNDLIEKNDVLNLLFYIFKESQVEIKAKLMQDLYLLVKWSQINIEKLSQNKEFWVWIIDILIERFDCMNDNPFMTTVWDLSIKIFIILMKFNINFNNNQENLIEKIDSILKILQIKSLEKNNIKFLIRTLWNNLLENLLDNSKNSKPGLSIIFWKNMGIISGFTIKIICSLFNKENFAKNLNDNKFSIFLYLTNIDENSNINIDSNCKELNWLDYKIVENLFLIYDCVWINELKEEINYFKNEKILNNYLEFNFSKELNKKLELLLNECFIENHFCKGSNFKHLSFLLFAVLEKTLENSKTNYFYIWINKYLIIFKSFLLFCESSKFHQNSPNLPILSSNLLFLIFNIYAIRDKYKEFLGLFNKPIEEIGKFICLIIDLLNEKKGQPNIIPEIFNYWVITSQEKQILTISRIKNLKVEQFSDLPNIVFSFEWISAFMSNNKLFDLFSQFSSINTKQEIYNNITKIQENKISFENNEIQREKNRELIKNRVENEMLEDFLYQFDINENKRMKLLYKTEKKRRETKHLWHKIWYRLRLPNGLYEIPIETIQNDKKFVFEDFEWENYKRQLFSNKILNFSIKNGIKPFLKQKIRNSELEKLDKKRINQDIRKSIQLESLFSFVNDPDFIFQEFSEKNEKLKKEEFIFIKNCQWIKQLTIRIGSISIFQSKIIFHFSSSEIKDIHIAMLPFKLSAGKNFYREWKFSNIKIIKKRRFILRKTAIEIYFCDGKSIFLNFLNRDNSEILQYFPQNLRENIKNPIKKWQHHKISNLDFLMRINSLASRSFEDLAQYPIFPWIIKNYTNEISLRDLSKNMGSLGNEDRIETFKQRFEHVEAFESIPKYHFGSHYSSPAIIMQYMIRLQPFTKGAKALQSGKFDLADRLFFSFAESFKGATEEISDIRELIPEFFYLPEILLNLEKHDFGIQQTGIRVNNILLPDWCEKNPYNFITIHRSILESESVSIGLSNWIDLIFGYKQKGKEAENSLNVFFYLTYEDGIDLNNLEDPELKISYESQIVHFGQTPIQLLGNPFPLKLKKESIFQDGLWISDPKAEFIVYTPGINDRIGIKNEKIWNENENIFYMNSNAIIKVKFLSENKFLTISRNGKLILYKWSDSPMKTKLEKVIPFNIIIEKQKILNIERTDYYRTIDHRFESGRFPFEYLSNLKILICGGLWDGKLNLFSSEKETLTETLSPHTDTITSIELDYKERFFITGTKNGECKFWKILIDNKKFMVMYSLHDHENEITSICISNEMKCFATAGLDSKIFIYKIFNGELIKGFENPDKLGIHKVLLSDSPLPCVIFFSKMNYSLYSYSINGQLIEKINEYFSITTCLLVKWIDFKDIIIYSNLNGDIIYRELPNLNVRKKIKNDSKNGNKIIDICISKDNKFLLCGNLDGSLSIISDPSYAKSIFNPN